MYKDKNFVSEYGACPYLPDRLWSVMELPLEAFTPHEYELALSLGWRRSGDIYYRNCCAGCSLCIPIRIRAADFQPSKSQKAATRRNADIRISLHRIGFSGERFDLYRRYQNFQHGSPQRARFDLRQAYLMTYMRGMLSGEPDMDSGPHGDDLSRARDGTAIVEYRTADSDRLVGTGYVDILPQGISSIYFAFDPEAAKRSLGTWSVEQEIALAAESGRSFYYLGFWVPGAPKMDYKANFRPFELALPSGWTRFENREAALACLNDIP